jgi:PIN domain nuclease of toxin-antitoxin system
LSNGLLLDTHAWIWLRAGTLAAGPEALAQLRQAAQNGTWFISTFSYFEIAHAVARGRIQLDRPLRDWLRESSGRNDPQSIELSPEIAAATATLPASFHGDPGDRLITATALVHGLTICTHDNNLLRYGRQGLVSVLRINEK